MKLKKYKKKKISSHISRNIIFIILSLILSLVIINYFAKKSNDILLPLAVSKTRKYVNMTINSAIDEVKLDKDLYMINKDNNNEIKMITYNSYEVTKLINEVTMNIEDKLRRIENNEINYYNESTDYRYGGVISEIPFGVIFGNSMLANVGPKIKLRMNIIGDIISNIETEVKPYGINNAYVEMRITLTVTARIYLPFVSDTVSISNVIPLSMNIVQGNIPEAYISSYK